MKRAWLEATTWLKKHKYRILAACLAILSIGLGCILGRGDEEDKPLAKKRAEAEGKGLETEISHLESKVNLAKAKAEKADMALAAKKRELAEKAAKWDAEDIAREFRQKGY